MVCWLNSISLACGILAPDRLARTGAGIGTGGGGWKTGAFFGFGEGASEVLAESAAGAGDEGHTSSEIEKW